MEAELRSLRRPSGESRIKHLPAVPRGVYHDPHEIERLDPHDKTVPYTWVTGGR